MRAFDKERAAKLAASDKRSYYNQESMTKETAKDEIVESASHSKITEPRQDPKEMKKAEQSCQGKPSSKCAALNFSEFPLVRS